MNCYRVWMRDGYVSLQNAETEEEAKKKACEAAAKEVEPLAMTVEEKQRACLIHKVECLSE